LVPTPCLQLLAAGDAPVVPRYQRHPHQVRTDDTHPAPTRAHPGTPCNARALTMPDAVITVAPASSIFRAVAQQGLPAQRHAGLHVDLRAPSVILSA
jgi:hypothetical protein